MYNANQIKFITAHVIEARDYHSLASFQDYKLEF
jgi:hypothetical protein